MIIEFIKNKIKNNNNNPQLLKTSSAERCYIY